MNASKQNSPQYILEVIGPSGLTRVVLGEQPISIGRHSDNKLPIDDLMASRFHCLIGLKDGRAWVRDLNSSNGTFVNGNKVAAAELSIRDVVTVGAIRMTLVVSGGAVAEVNPGGRPRRRNPAAPLIGDIRPPAPLDLETPAEDAGIDDLPSLDDIASLEDVETIEELGVEDVVEVDPLKAFGSSSEDEDDRIKLSQADPTGGSYAVDADAVLRELATALPDRTFTESDIAFMSARGQKMHPQGRAQSEGEFVGLFRRLFLVASRCRATDVHIEPREGGFQVRMRVDGMMIDVVRMPTPVGIRVQAMVKVLSEIDLAQRHAIQEGHFTSLVPTDKPPATRRIDYRVSFAPSVFGQKLVMRIMDAHYAPMHVRSLQLPPWMREEVERTLRQDAGLLLVCGPTGSGKTTTLYALLRGSNVQQRNVVTIEDPIEIQLGSVTQIPVDEEHDKGFANLLRSVLRQDPDVVMIGEIRDSETARIAMQAAITGHLVFSTLHTRDTPGAVFRLLDLGVEPYLVAQAINVVLAQRLVRQLCPNCKVGYAPNADQTFAMGESGRGIKRIYRPGGCPRCLGTGYWGRKAFFELLTANDALREAIVKQPTPQTVQAALASIRFQSLQQSAYELVAEGAVAFDEIERALGKNANPAP